MRVKKWKKSQSFLTLLIMGTSLFVPLSLQAQEMQLKLPELNLPRPIDEQNSDDSTLDGQTDQKQGNDQNQAPNQSQIPNQPQTDEQQQSVVPHQNVPEIKNTPKPQTENNTSTNNEATTQSPVQSPIAQEGKSDEASKQERSQQEQSNLAQSEATSNGQENVQEPASSATPSATVGTTPNPSSSTSGESINNSVQPNNTDANSNANAPVDVGTINTQNNENKDFENTGAENNAATNEPVNATPLEGDQAALSNALEDTATDENNPVVGIIDAIVKERNPALKVDASRNDIFRFVSTERKGVTLIYHAAAPSLVTSPEWDGLTMTTIMCKEQRLRPDILDGKAAIKIEMNVVSPAGEYTFVADAHSCKQLTPEGDIINQSIEQPDLVADALSAEAKRLSLFSCLKNNSTEILENCSLGMVPRTSWEWQLQDITTDQRKVMMTYLNTDEKLDEVEINRVINRTCAKEEIHSIIELGVVYDITVLGKSKKHFLIDKQACDSAKD